jgi:hypothetical protein
MARTIRLFVSSTFSDLELERDALQRSVFLRLRSLCTQHGWRFHAVDLRWGIGEEAMRDQLTTRICLSEIERCQRIARRPNFLLLLSDRFGWRPLPAEIPPAECALQASMSSGSSSVSSRSTRRRLADDVVPCDGLTASST